MSCYLVAQTQSIIIVLRSAFRLLRKSQRSTQDDEHGTNQTRMPETIVSNTMLLSTIP